MAKKRRRRRKPMPKPETELEMFLDTFGRALQDSFAMKKRGTAIPWLKEMKSRELEELLSFLEARDDERQTSALVLAGEICRWEMNLPGPPEELTEREFRFLVKTHFELTNVTRMLLWKRRGWIEWEPPEFVFGYLDGEQQHFVVYPTEKGKEAGVEAKLKAIGELQQL